MLRMIMKSDSLKQSKNTVECQKDNTYIAIDNDDTVGFKVVRPLDNELKDKIEQSSLLCRTGQLYMHYWTTDLICTNRNDPEWQNKVMFFWKAEEPFPKKSLPPYFQDFQTKYFLFGSDTSNISLKVGQAIPWFGMPGLGEKHVCVLNGENMTVPELNDLGLVDYIEQVELTLSNIDILTNRGEYFFLIDERITPFQNGNFYLKGKPIPIHIAYSVGGIHIVKKV
ncbi:hypothetical protein V3468_12720 [Flavobacterium oreochromis]